MSDCEFIINKDIIIHKSEIKKITISGQNDNDGLKPSIRFFLKDSSCPLFEYETKSAARETWIKLQKELQ